MRIDRTRLESEFPYSFPIATRFSDLDIVGHINNVAVADLLQEGRNRFFHASGLMGTAPAGLVVAAMTVEFAGDLFHPEPIEISIGVLEVGRTSLRLAEVIRQHGNIAVYAEVVQVARDDNGSTPLPEAWRPLLEKAMVAPK